MRDQEGSGLIMRKIKLLCLLLACLFILSGCYNSDLPIKRATNKVNDVIKFYGFDWLTERSTIEKKFNGDFESGYVCKEDSTIGKDGLELVTVLYKGKDETDLNWSVADHNVSELLLYYIKSQSGKYYLYRGIWRFNHCNEEDEAFFIAKLNKLYPNTKTDTTVFVDKNINQINLSRIDSTKEIALDYCCFDVLYQLSKEVNNQSQESNNALPEQNTK